jgi:hypothetical protein
MTHHPLVSAQNIFPGLVPVSIHVYTPPQVLSPWLQKHAVPARDARFRTTAPEAEANEDGSRMCLTVIQVAPLGKLPS